MIVFISNDHGGEISRIKFVKEDEDCFGSGVILNGFIETPSAKSQHSASPGIFAKEELCYNTPKTLVQPL